MSALLTPLRVGALDLANRIVIAPMCQHSAVDGCMTDFAQALEARGCAAIHVSSGGLIPSQQIPVGPSYQVPLARAVKRATRTPVIAVGLITEFEQAEAIVGTGDADLIALRGRSSTTRAGLGMPPRTSVGK